MGIYRKRILYATVLDFLFIITATPGFEPATSRSSVYRRLSDKHRTAVFSQLRVIPNMSFLKCVSQCLETGSDCQAFTRTTHGDCVILGLLRNMSGLPWVCTDVDCSDVFYTDEGLELEMMVLRLTARQSISAIEGWGEKPATDLEQAVISRALNLGEPFNRTLYRHPLIDSWEDWNILRVTLSLYTEGQEVLRLELNGTRTNSTSWFSLSNLISSPWTDLNNNVEFFTISHPEPGLFRQFYINGPFIGCSNDMGWLAVFDKEDVCQYSTYPEYPVFVYVSGNQRQKWTQADKFETADDLVVSVWLRL